MSTKNKEKKRYFMKVYPELCPYLCTLSLKARYVLSAFWIYMSIEFKDGDKIGMDYGKAVYYLKKIFSDEQLKSFTASRFSEGVKELVNQEILKRTDYSRHVFWINKKLFNMDSVDKNEGDS